MVSIIQDTVETSIKSHGQALVAVPGFVYTIGNALSGFPELLMLGNFSPYVTGGILNELGRYMRDSGEPLPLGLTGVGDYPLPFLIRLTGPKAKAEYTLQATAFLERDDYDVLQIMLCDRRGCYPDDPDCDPTFRVELL